MKGWDPGWTATAVCVVSVLILLDARLVPLLLVFAVPLAILGVVLWSGKRFDEANQDRDTHHPY